MARQSHHQPQGPAGLATLIDSLRLSQLQRTCMSFALRCICSKPSPRFPEESSIEGPDYRHIVIPSAPASDAAFSHTHMFGLEPREPVTSVLWRYPDITARSMKRQEHVPDTIK